jgi:hypothetical protein
MVAVPPLMPVTSPVDELTEATPGLSLVHKCDPVVVASVSVRVVPVQRVPPAASISARDGKGFTVKVFVLKKLQP